MFPHKWGKELLPVITSETNLTTYRPSDLTSSSDTVLLPYSPITLLP